MTQAAVWCWCGLHWLPAHMWSHLEEAVNHTRESCLPVDLTHP
jgi:hypothetical protein